MQHLWDCMSIFIWKLEVCMKLFFFFFLKWVKEETSLIFKKLYKTTDQTKYDFSSELKVCDVIKVLILQKIIF